MPVTPQEGVEIPVREAFDGRRDLALERQAAHLAVGHDRDARVLRQAQGLVDGVVLHGLEIGGAEPACSEPLACREEPRRTEQAADHVAAGLDHQAMV